VKVLILAVAIALGGCASTQSKIPRTLAEAYASSAVRAQATRKVADPLDPYCAELAKYARAVAILRDGGMVAADVGFVVAPRIQIPTGPIVRDVFTRQDFPPAAVEDQAYKSCRAMTFERMVDALTAAEENHLATEMERSKKELELIKRTYVTKRR
jgi:hypothetical protein